MPSEATKNRLDALTIVASAAATVTAALLGLLLSHYAERLAQAEQHLQQLQLASVKHTEHSAAHDTEKTHWIGEIIGNGKRSRANERRLDRLETKPSARPSAYTSLDGQRDRDYARSLERRIKQLEQMN